MNNGSVFLLILVAAFAPAIAFMCWCELRDWRPSYLRHKPISPEAPRAK
jgi:hypothetical protein